TDVFLGKIRALLAWVLPRYVREGKSYLTIAVGCTGGRHRSVMVANALAARFSAKDYAVRVYHRDVRQS
ncbi:MAG TPA: RNase adapter RapZ, partial [Vicinamibacteria bacterium]